MNWTLCNFELFKNGHQVIKKEITSTEYFDVKEEIKSNYYKWNNDCNWDKVQQVVLCYYIYQVLSSYPTQLVI